MTGVWGAAAAMIERCLAIAHTTHERLQALALASAAASDKRRRATILPTVPVAVHVDDLLRCLDVCLKLFENVGAHQDKAMRGVLSAMGWLSMHPAVAGTGLRSFVVSCCTLAFEVCAGCVGVLDVHPSGDLGWFANLCGSPAVDAFVVWWLL